MSRNHDGRNIIAHKMNCLKTHCFLKKKVGITGIAEVQLHESGVQFYFQSGKREEKVAGKKIPILCYVRDAYIR